MLQLATGGELSMFCATPLGKETSPPVPFPFADVTLHSLVEEFIAVNMTDDMLSPVSSLSESLNLGVVWKTPNILSQQH